MRFAAIIVAAGSGSRMGGLPKQWRMLAGRPVLKWSLDAFRTAGADPVVLVVAPEDRELAQALAGLEAVVTAGGATRTDSVRSGLALCGEAEAILIHDAARPLVSQAHIRAVLEALDEADGAVPALPVADTLKRATDDGAVTVDREGLWRAQTPQGFRHGVLQAAYDRWPANAPATDDAAVVEASGGRIALVPGDPRLMKITYPEDFGMIERLAHGTVTAVGQGFDAHRLGPGDGVWLCGVKVASDLALIGHSDADAGLHALTDAILGAIGAGDIGDHFPPTEPQWKGVSSDRFLIHALDLVKEKSARLINVDITLICETPRIKPHREAMRLRVADICGLPLARVSIKATTTEGMGFTGRREGVAAQAVASIELPDPASS